MTTQSEYGAPISGFLDAFIDPQSAIYLLGALLVVATSGALVGMLSRNIAILLGIGTLVTGSIRPRIVTTCAPATA